MVRFAGAGRWVWRHPIIGLPLLTWVLLTPLAHWLLPVTPIQRIDVTELVPPGETSKPARHPDYPDRAIFTTVDIEKNTACTAIETTTAKGHAYLVGPYRVWDLGQRKQLIEVVDEDAWATRGGPMLCGDWLPIRRGDGPNYMVSAKETVFYHVPTGKKGPRIPTGRFIVSADNRWVGYITVDAIHVLELESQRSHPIPLPRDAKKDAIPFWLYQLSPDGRFVVVMNNNLTIVLDSANGEVVANVSDFDRSSTLSFSPDNAAIARSVWGGSFKGVIVNGLGGEKELTRILGVSFLDWHPSGAMFVQRHRGRDAEGTEPCRIEIRRKESENWLSPTAKWTSPPGGLSRPKVSHDGRRILFIQPSHRDHVAVQILDGENLHALDRWTVNCVERCWGDVMFDFTPDGETVIVNHMTALEYWSIPVRSWLKSSLWAGGAMLVLGMIVAVWRCRSKRATISPVAPPI